MSATVVVPTRNRPEALERCLEGLRAQEGIALEIVVVDDGSADRVSVAARANESRGLLVRLEGRGPAAARNAGVAVASSETILLLDDDCVPLPGWAEAMAAALAGRPRHVVGGTVRLSSGATLWLRASEQIARGAEAGTGFFRTLNLATSAALLQELPFDAGFPIAAGEDRDWCLRAGRAGATFAREPGAIVEHRADLDAPSFVRQQLRYGRAVHRLRGQGTHVAVSGRAQRRGLAEGFRESASVGLAMTLAPALTAAGYAVEVWADHRSR